MNTTTPLKPRPPPGQQGSTPFRSASASRFRSSLVPMSRPSPARSSQHTGKPAPSYSYGRDLFRTSTPQTARTNKFAPNLPAEATRTTPGGRKFAQKTSSHGGMYGIPSTEPFKMRIPSPDPELSGEALSKEVPNDTGRGGTIYADQFLAHKCPPNFDDLQRRQFFCILDLRRLKYAADEIFTKKDWKLNIMNFAKEYEKSRGLIMLRYGLYEFKNVKPSEEVLKRWRAAHNLPEPEPQAEKSTVPGTPTQSNRRSVVPGSVGAKRKAEEDLAPKDNALMASTANQNKRRNVAQERADAALTAPAPFKKSKRKVDETDEPDENQPNKVQRPTPSAAKSKFESILNRAQSGSTSPLKRPPLTSFGAPKSNESEDSSLASKSNPFATSTNGFKPATVESIKEDTSASSVFAGNKAGSMPAKASSNIFSYLSESSANSSGNENANVGDGDTESESEEEAASQEAPQSAQPSAAGSAGTNTPSTQSGSSLFSASNPTTSSNPFGGPAKPSDLASKGGLFGRVQMGSNGQPLRATADAEGRSVFAPAKQPAAEKEQIKTPAKQPGDYTFNPATTPISFGPPTSSAAKAPAALPNAESTKEPSTSESATAKPTPALFGASASASPAFQPSGSSLFGASSGASSSSPLKLNGAASSIFSGQKTTPTPSNLFSPATSSKPLFGSAAKTNEADSSAPKEQQKAVPDTAPVTTSITSQAGADKAPADAKETTSLFSPAAIATVPTTQTTSLFGNNVKATKVSADVAVSGRSLFANSAKEPASNLFGGSSNTVSAGVDNAKVNAPKPTFDTPSKQSSTGFSFGASKPESAAEINKASNGFNQEPNNSSTPAPKSVFGSEATKPINTTGSSLFGGSSTISTNIFGAKNGEATPAEKKPTITATPSLFGNKPVASTNLFNSKSTDVVLAEKKEETTTKPTSIFGSASPSPGPSFTFGTQPAATQAATPPPVIFGAGSSTSNDQSKKPEVQFGSSTPSASTSFTFGNGQGPADSGFTFSAGGNGQSFNNPFASSNTAAPAFGANASTPGPSASSSFNFSFGQGAPSTPTPAPASQGTPIFGASSNGGNPPSFSFTQATPTQDNSNPFAPKPTPNSSGSFGSFLQATNDASTRATSPFPAPSSIGTTPVSGTPEPQTQEDGEEAPQEQISLTNGGPGEEDETILHEVRAKAIKFVPIVAGDEEEERKSPWSTQGVGPLRVLKNKTTGAVRVLLRAEPRGHIAMNKAILPDGNFKVKEKTVSLVAASDDGSALETWVLQVKKPEFAQQLASVLEANKGANRK